VPTGLLSELYPRGIISPDLVECLLHYGLRTFGKIALLPQSTLCRQFGMTAGTFLAAVAIGNDPWPGKPAGRRMSHGLRIQFATPTSPEGLLAALPYLSRSAATLLQKHRLLTSRLRIRLVWAGNTRAEQVRITLRRPTADSRILAENLRKLALQLLTGRSLQLESGAGEVEALQLFMEDEAPVKPAQQFLWEVRQGVVESGDPYRREQRLATLQTISSTLTRRYGQMRASDPPLFQHRLARPDAIFPEERYSKAGIVL
jgi:hypothetical protein